MRQNRADQIGRHTQSLLVGTKGKSIVRLLVKECAEEQAPDLTMIRESGKSFTKFHLPLQTSHLHSAFCRWSVG